MVKKNRHKEVSIVCQPQYFAGAQFLERDTQIEMLDGLLYRPKNAKQKRNLIVAVASSGMGKSAFVDEYCRRRSSETDLNCITISFNTNVFGGSLKGSAAIDLAARFLMSYFMSNPSKSFLAIIYNELRKKYRRTFEDDNGVLKAAVEYIKMDLLEQKGYDATTPKILIACDEVGKSDKEKKVVALLTELIDEDDDLECFFTGLSLKPFAKETASGRCIQYVPLPLLNFTSSLRLVQSFINGSGSFNVSSKLARLSGGHPRTIQIFYAIVATNNWNAMQWTDRMVEIVVDSALSKSINFLLSESEILLLLRPRTLRTDIKRNADLIEALGEGRIYATISENMYVDLFTSPLMLRGAVLYWSKVENTNAKLLIKTLNEMLKLVGLRDLREFRKANADMNGKIFEDFFLNMEMLRRVFKFSKLEVQRVQSFENFYPTVQYSQNCKKGYRYELASDYNVVNITCQNDFPSNKSVDAAVVMGMKSLICGSSATDLVFRPSKSTQSGYDFFFIFKDLSTGMRYVQLIEPTLSAGGATPDTFFTERYLKKLRAVQSLAWAEIGIDAENIVHTFISTGNTSRIDWETVFKSAGYSDSRILILDRANLKAFFGPMLDVLYSCGFDDN